MTLPAGTRIDHYEVVAPIGAGGMGEVYRARDPRLGRDVALKVLAATLVSDPDLHRRFEQEARAAATLNHPNILAIHDVGRHRGTPYLVSELLEGTTLRAQLTNGPLPVRKAIDYALQIAHGLAAAHEKGIVHRDLKPENLFVTADGRVKILDFGLAKALGDVAAEARTMAASQVTKIGMVLGTIGYMAPEQIRGLPADHRSDIFAFGCILYEMLGGRRAFSGATPADTMSAILSSEPTELDVPNAAIPPALFRIVRHCLEKAPIQRFQSAEDLAFAIENVTNASAPAVASPGATLPSKTWTRTTGATVALLSTVILSAGGAYWLGRRSVHDSRLALGRTVGITREEGIELHPSLSPDGTLIAYASGPGDRTHVFVRQVAGGRAIDLTPSMLGTYPRWSPDGSRILFTSTTGAYVVPALGGLPRSIIADALSADWSPDGQEIVYVAKEGIYVQPVDGGAPRTLVNMRETHSPAWSPDKRLIAFVAGNPFFMGPGRLVGNIAPSRIMIVPSVGGTPSVVTSAGTLNVSPTWTADGRHLLFVSNAFGTRDIFQIAINAEGQSTGDPDRLTAGLNAHSIMLSRDGRRLAYSTLTLSSNIWSIRIPERPPISVREAVPVTSGDQIVEGVAISPDRQWLAFDSNMAGSQDIYRLRLPHGEPEQITTDPADEFEPAWAPDGSQIAFHAWPGNNRDVFVIGADGHGRQRLTNGAAHEWFPSWSPDGKRIAFSDDNRNGISFVQRTESGWSAPVFLTEAPGSPTPVFSPDGQSLLLTGSTPDHRDVRIIAADGARARTLINGTLVGGAVPTFARWSKDGRRVYLFAVDAEGRSSMWSMPAEGGTPTLLVRFDDPARESNRREFDTDDQHIYFTLARKEGDVGVIDIR
jgi:eukaryotic-like serine/threonine-protein kinase